ncbi:hypothetical protein [Bradyrhizobium sp. STM 3561]|uniref:hypothetical protein n=1 Tax=Bradyrhizobium sp. STM 3561 TaxID=578923 RepID=UPI00388F5335
MPKVYPVTVDYGIILDGEVGSSSMMGGRPAAQARCVRQRRHPPCLAQGAAVRKSLLNSVNAVISDPEVKSTALTCVGRVFIAGDDIMEFGKPA